MYAKNPDSQKKKPFTPEKPKQTRSQSDSWKIYGGSFFVIALVFFVTFQFIEPAPPKSLTIATGDINGAYYSYAQQIKTELAKHDIALNIINTSGSLDNIDLLNDASQNVDLAFVQSGVAKPKDNTTIMGLGSLYYEPLWLFSTSPIKSGKLQGLRGKTVAVGITGSGTFATTQLLLQENGLTDSVNTIELYGTSALNALSAGEIDAMFTVVSPNSALINALLNTDGLYLTSFARAQAYEQQFKFLSHIRIPEGAINLKKNIPSREINLVAPAATLLAKETLHPALSDLIMQITTEMFSSGNLLAADGQFPSPQYLDFPLSTEAARFYKNGPSLLQRYLPFWAATLIDRLKVLLLPLLALLIPLMKILPPTYRWSVRKRIFHWYEQLQHIDQSSNEIASEENLELCLANLDKIEQEVREIEIPLSYANELYMLRQHIDLLARQISVQEKEAEQIRLNQDKVQ